MERGARSQFGAATGIVAVVVIAVGFAIFSNNIPHSDASAQEWQKFFADHQNRIQAGMTIVGVGALFFLWFLGSLRDAIAGAEGGGQRLATIAHSGGLFGVLCLAIGSAGYLAAAFHPLANADVIHAFADFGGLVAAPASAGFVALFAATAVAGYRLGAFPAPVAGICATAAIGQLFAYPTGATDHGAFAPDGFFGLWVPFVTFVVAVIVLSANMYSRAGRAA